MTVFMEFELSVFLFDFGILNFTVAGLSAAAAPHQYGVSSSVMPVDGTKSSSAENGRQYFV